MCACPSDSAKGFSLIEMLVALSIVLLLSGLTLGAMRASGRSLVVRQAAARLVMQIELAQGVAASTLEPVYLVLADLGSEPAGAPMRAYSLLKNPPQPEWILHWQFLPKELVFAFDTQSAGADLIRESPLQYISSDFPDQGEMFPVNGRLRVLLEILPDGRYRSGAARAARPCSLLLARGRWTMDAALNPHFVPEKGGASDQVRILFRPLTGVVKAEEAPQ